MLTKLLAFLAATLFVGAAFAQPAQLQVTDAWARATPGKSDNGAAYVTIQSPTADRLVSASSPVAKKVELHTMTMEGSTMKMRPMAGLDIPGGQAVSLKPGGEHMMLIGLDHPLHEGQSFPLTLDFEKAGPRTVTVAVEKVGAKGPGQTAAHEHH